MRSESLTEAQKRYSKKLIQFNVKYQLHEIEEGKALQQYLQSTNQTANDYIKRLIQTDLQSKGILKGRNQNGQPE
jgi:predicted HicB family RNase H-like nuclease|nr:MAG TPA: hypothetical protein [Inoviridae sp.]